jgi:NAD(P)-dependent dehydrogenase (short-subunit alcohol dehydrogenase family)
MIELCHARAWQPAAMATGRLAGKTAVIVGAGQTAGETLGNGRATALLFAREGARLLLVDRDRASVEETVRIVEAEGGEATAHVCDIADAAACEAMAGVAAGVLGRIDVLHNNVGIGAGDSSPGRLEEDAWDRIMEVNLKAMWRTCKHVVPDMRAQGGGAIVNISSLAAIAAATTLTAYKISKAGVNALTQNLALANARHGIRANAIMPGFIDTPMAVDAAAGARGVSREDLAKFRASRVPLGRQGSAWDVAHAALFLASDDARFITGALLPVDGGQSSQIG